MRGNMRFGWIFAISFFVALFVAATLYLAKNNSSPIERSNPELEKKLSEPKTPTSISTRLLVGGDVFWGRQTEIWANESAEPIKFPFQGLNTFEREKYDAWIGTMECPITSTAVPFERQKNELKFNCLPEYLEEAKKWFNAFNTASNHTDNMQEVDGFDQTLKNLEKHDIQHFGHFDAGVNDEICEVLSFPARAEPVDNENQNSDVYLPVAFCGYNNVYRLPTEQELDAITPYSKQFFTIATPQQGEEYKPAADELKIEYFRKMVDKGADSIIGGQPHWVQNTEVYKEKLIVYSVGNFMFDQRWSPDVMRGIGVDITLTAVYDENVQAWLDIAEQCKNHNDSCLEKAKNKGLEKIGFRVKYDIVAVDATGRFSVKGDKQLLDALKQRANWASTSANLQKSSP
ncbi:hypothetical protein DYH10_02945 [Candidatus Saccharibacteria bacterium CPR2]|nr:hypothetical protein [Candidatus Saccharibacteria bacterium CPR2]